ncbi:MAG TPA: AAA family ATPase [Anaerolineae bacterium]|nr:AAA family ATPase [Anaerolineae bacterium]HQK15739.1 AAA family ATPase [Anaerolineae bacterium]
MESKPDYLFVRATTLEEAWSRFDPAQPLPVGSPFYVEREDNPLGRLQRALLLARGNPPKYFFTGHRGSGKSTELNRLVADAAIQKRYWPVKFSVRDECDFNDLTHIEVLLAMGAQIFKQYHEAGGQMKDDLLRELETWKGRTLTRLTEKGATFESGSGVDIGKFFLSALLKVKTEHVTRELMRQEIAPRVSELIGLINLMSAEILAQSKRQVLVVIEDMDKPPLEVSRKLFEGALTTLLQPVCAIVYTVPVAIYFDPAFVQIRDTSYFLPNIKLHEKRQRMQLHKSGIRAMRAFVLARMADTLIAGDALDEAVRNSGGVFREIAHILQRAIDNALARKAAQIELQDVAWATAQIRSGFRRLLTQEDYRWLLEVRRNNDVLHPEHLGPLFHVLAILEYANGETWCDVHPALDPLLDEIAGQMTPVEA